MRLPLERNNGLQDGRLHEAQIDLLEHLDGLDHNLLSDENVDHANKCPEDTPEQRESDSSDEYHFYSFSRFHYISCLFRVFAT